MSVEEEDASAGHKVENFYIRRKSILALFQTEGIIAGKPIMYCLKRDTNVNYYLQLLVV